MAAAGLPTNLVTHYPANNCTAHGPHGAPACKHCAGYTTDAGTDCCIRASSRHPGTPSRQRCDQQHRAAQSCYSIVTHLVHLHLDPPPKHLVAENAEARLEFSVLTMNGVQPIRSPLRPSVCVARMSQRSISSPAWKVSVRWQTRGSRGPLSCCLRACRPQRNSFHLGQQRTEFCTVPSRQHLAITSLCSHKSQ